MFKKIWKGTSWIEIGILASVLLSLVAITVPNFSRFKCRAKQSEARFELARIHAAQKLHFAEFGVYIPFEDLLEKQRVAPHDKYYIYRTHGESSAKFFTVEAVGRKGTQVEGDTWTIDQDKNLLNTNNVCL